MHIVDEKYFPEGWAVTKKLDPYQPCTTLSFNDVSILTISGRGNEEHVWWYCSNEFVPKVKQIVKEAKNKRYREFIFDCARRDAEAATAREKSRQKADEALKCLVK